MSETLQLVNNYGLPLVILIFIGWIGIWIAKRLFNEKNGIFTTIAAKHIEFMERVAVATEQNTKTVNEIRETHAEVIEINKELATTNANIESAFVRLLQATESIQDSLSDSSELASNHKKTHRSINHICRVLTRLVEAKAPELMDSIRPHIDAIKSIIPSDQNI